VLKAYVIAATIEISRYPVWHICRIMAADQRRQMVDMGRGWDPMTTLHEPFFTLRLPKEDSLHSWVNLKPGSFIKSNDFLGFLITPTYMLQPTYSL
jgi:hypothetical protein